MKVAFGFVLPIVIAGFLVATFLTGCVTKRVEFFAGFQTADIVKTSTDTATEIPARGLWGWLTGDGKSATGKEGDLRGVPIS